MIEIVTAANRGEYASQLDEMHRHRKQVFVDRLKWDVPVVDGVLEIDQFDNDDAVYLLALDDQRHHLGSTRLLPSLRPHLMTDVFPHLCEEGVPVGEDIWEVSRFFTSPEVAKEHANPVRRRVMIGMVEFAVHHRINRYTLVTHMGFVSTLLAIGWECAPLGLPQATGSGTVAAMTINMTTATMEALRHRSDEHREAIERLTQTARAA